jgi:hypothetical protein
VLLSIREVEIVSVVVGLSELIVAVKAGRQAGVSERLVLQAKVLNAMKRPRVGSGDATEFPLAVLTSVYEVIEGWCECRMRSSVPDPRAYCTAFWSVWHGCVRYI